MWLLQGPSLSLPGITYKTYTDLVSSPGAIGVFHTDSSQRMLAISMRMVTREGDKKQRHNFTFMVYSSALISLALRERWGATIEWEKWKEKATMINRGSRVSSTQVEGSRAFFLVERKSQGDEVSLMVYHFSPGARKEQGNLPYTLRYFNFNVTPSVGQRYRSWRVSGDTVVLFDVRDLNFVHTCLVLRLSPATWRYPKPLALQRHHLVCLKLQLLHSRSCCHILSILSVALIIISTHSCHLEHLMGAISPTSGWHRKESKIRIILFSLSIPS